MAPVGQEAIRVGTSQILGSTSWRILGGLRWMPSTAMSEQCTAPHMFRQQATAIRSLAGSFSSTKYGNSSSIMHFTRPEASVAEEWQCTQPCVWTMLLMLALVPPTG